MRWSAESRFPGAAVAAGNGATIADSGRVVSKPPVNSSSNTRPVTAEWSVTRPEPPVQHHPTPLFSRTYRKCDFSGTCRRITVAVGTIITDRPPHRAVRARLRIRLLRRMSGVEAGIRIGVQNAGWRNPPVQDWGKAFPTHLCALAAADQNTLP
jgi:hypothetical protein